MNLHRDGSGEAPNRKKTTLTSPEQKILDAVGESTDEGRRPNDIERPKDKREK